MLSAISLSSSTGSICESFVVLRIFFLRVLVLVLGLSVFDYENEDGDEDDFVAASAALCDEEVEKSGASRTFLFLTDIRPVKDGACLFNAADQAVSGSELCDRPGRQKFNLNCTNWERERLGRQLEYRHENQTGAADGDDVVWCQRLCGRPNERSASHQNRPGGRFDR